MTPNRAMLPEHFKEFSELERRMMYAPNPEAAFLAANKVICRGLELEALGYIVPTNFGLKAYYHKEIANQYFWDSTP